METKTFVIKQPQYFADTVANILKAIKLNSYRTPDWIQNIASPVNTHTSQFIVQGFSLPGYWRIKFIDHKRKNTEILDESDYIVYDPTCNRYSVYTEEDFIKKFELHIELFEEEKYRKIIDKQ